MAHKVYVTALTAAWVVVLGSLILYANQVFDGAYFSWDRAGYSGGDMAAMLALGGVLGFLIGRAERGIYRRVENE